jgi:predicted O-methyltransferase YrrM
MRLLWRPQSPPHHPNQPGPAITTSLTARETAELCRLAAGRRVLEIGTADGFAAVAMALAGAAEVVTVDPHIALDSLETARANVAAWGVGDRVRLEVGTAAQVLGWGNPSYPDGSFELCFVDGDHQRPSVEADAAHAARLVRPGGVLAFHDYREVTCPGVTAALDALYPAGPRLLVDTLFVVPRGLDGG